MYDKIIKFIKSNEFKRRIGCLDRFQNEEQLINLMNYSVKSEYYGNPDLRSVINDLFSISANYIENADYNNMFYIKVAILIFCRCKNSNAEIGKVEFEDAINTFKKIEFHDEINTLSWEIKLMRKSVMKEERNFRFYYGDKEVAFKILKLNIPKPGDIIEINYDIDDEILEYLLELFEIEKYDIEYDKTQFFKYKVESVITRISTDHDGEDDAEYIVNVMPVI